MSSNPYVQIALTYVRRPFSSWFLRFASAFAVCAIVATAVADRYGGFKDSVFVQLLYFFSVFGVIAMHMKGQFVDSRARLSPGYRRVNATVAAIVALTVAGLLPMALSWFMGWRGIGFVAVVMLLFGTTLWVIVRDVVWMFFAMLLGWSAFCSTASGPAWFRELLSGQIELQAAAIFILGILVSLLAGMRLVRLTEDTLTCDSTLRWDWDWSQKTRQGWTGDGRILLGLRDWIREQELARLTRLARHASDSYWSRICRWQVGMVTGWSLGFWILGVVIQFQIMSWWILTKSPKPAAAMMGITFIVLTFIPAMIASVGTCQWRTFKLKQELLLPVERKSYVRQLGTAAAVSHFQLWASMSVAMVLWWPLIGPRPFQLALLGGVLAFSAVFQVGIFGATVWIARYCSGARGILVVLSCFCISLFPLQMWCLRRWSLGSPGQLLRDIMWAAGIIVAFGLLIAFDAYRRWLVADFDG